MLNELTKIRKITLTIVATVTAANSSTIELHQQMLSVTMSQRDLRPAIEYQTLPSCITNAIEEYHGIDKLDQKLLLKREYQLKKICMLCDTYTHIPIINELFNAAAGKYNYLTRLYKNLSIFRKNPFLGFVSHFFEFNKVSKKIPLNLVDIEMYRCVIDPYCNDYGARNYFKIWEQKCK